MSNLSDKNSCLPDSIQESTPRKKRPGFIQSELALALSAWNELETAAVLLSPDEEQLLKIKSLIIQLREKLENF